MPNAKAPGRVIRRGGRNFIQRRENVIEFNVRSAAIFSQFLSETDREAWRRARRMVTELRRGMFDGQEAA